MICDLRVRLGGRKTLPAWVASAALLATVLHPTVSHAETPIGGPVPSAPPARTVQGPARGRAAPGSPAVTPAPPRAVSQPVPGQKKPITIQLHPGIFAVIDQALLKTDMEPLTTELSYALKGVQLGVSSMRSYVGSYQKHADGCLKKSFSAEDQTKAGCTGNDTVNQCSEKLFWICLKTTEPHFPAHRTLLLLKIEALEKTLKEYSAKLKMIPAK